MYSLSLWRTIRLNARFSARQTNTKRQSDFQLTMTLKMLGRRKRNAVDGGEDVLRLTAKLNHLFNYELRIR